MNKQANKQTSKQANKQTSKQANKQTSKQANKRLCLPDLDSSFGFMEILQLPELSSGKKSSALLEETVPRAFAQQYHDSGGQDASIPSDTDGLISSGGDAGGSDILVNGT